MASFAALKTVQPAVAAGCPVCAEPHNEYAFTVVGRTFSRCAKCRTITAPPLTQTQGHHVYEEAERDPLGLRQAVVDALAERGAKGPYLIVAEANDPVASAVRHALGDASEATLADCQDVAAQKRCNTILLLTPATYSAAFGDILEDLASALPPEGHLLVLQPMMDSSQARFLGRHWPEWQRPHTCYLTRDTLHIALLKAGLHRVWFRRARHAYSLDYLQRKLTEAHTGLLSRLVSTLNAILPPLRQKRFKLPSSQLIAISQPAPRTGQPMLSVIVPVYNEKNTFIEMMEALLAKKVPGLRREIIIVESNSTDGTQELVKRYENHTDVRVMYQPKPRGKGFAVREGLAAATGDYVLIQDADLEYDLNDYDALLEPLRANQAMFVLGSRHRGHWKMREFNDAPMTAAVFNIGHVFFTTFLNVLLGQRMTDPFTMFKVIRRDALYGLDFICNRFDFDHELVIKLVRKGYKPLELPVNYRARSFAEGKKVSFVKDGLTWVTTDLRLRFGRLGQFRH